ncbi:MAG: hypothetical protein WC969_06560 [Elusimicrobiota bacterium]|jgi:hypothetical protein
MKLLLALFALLAATPACAQLSLPGFGVAASTVDAVVISSTPYTGILLPGDRGPWVVGETRFTGYVNVSEYALQNRIRARRGVLYTPSDVTGDVREIQTLPGVLSARADLYAQPNMPVPENYNGISVSTMMVRIVYTIEEKPLILPGLKAGATEAAQTPQTQQAGGAQGKTAAKQGPPVSVSGVVFTPTAYRGLGRENRPGLGLDVNTLYYIGRLYGKNDYSTRKTNYIDRIGQWFVCIDGKMQVQTEGQYRPAVAAGAMGIFAFRDAPQPSYQSSFNVTVKPTEKSSKQMAGAYMVASKKVYNVRTSLGYMQGSAGDMTASLSEFFAKESLNFNGHPNQSATSKSTFFASALYMVNPSYPIGFELVKPNGMVLNPYLINFKLGRFLRLNFDLAYLKFRGGWDLLGSFHFRFTQFPKGK